MPTKIIEDTGMKPQDDRFFDKVQKMENRYRENYYAIQRAMNEKRKQEHKK